MMSTFRVPSEILYALRTHQNHPLTLALLIAIATLSGCTLDDGNCSKNTTSSSYIEGTLYLCNNGYEQTIPLNKTEINELDTSNSVCLIKTNTTILLKKDDDSYESTQCPNGCDSYNEKTQCLPETTKCWDENTLLTFDKAGNHTFQTCKNGCHQDFGVCNLLEDKCMSENKLFKTENKETINCDAGCDSDNRQCYQCTRNPSCSTDGKARRACQSDDSYAFEECGTQENKVGSCVNGACVYQECADGYKENSDGECSRTFPNCTNNKVNVFLGGTWMCGIPLNNANDVRKYLNKASQPNDLYVITQNIAIGTQENWQALGGENGFQGALVGLDESITISGTLQCQNSESCGFFSKLVGGAIRNLRFNLDVTCDDAESCGIVAGELNEDQEDQEDQEDGSPFIQNVMIAGTLHCDATQCGSLAGVANHAEVLDVLSTAKIEADDCHDSVGGIVGNASKSLFHDVAYIGQIHASASNVGGIVGQDGASTIVNSRVVAQIDAKNATHVGGMTGYVGGYHHIYNSFAIADIDGPEQNRVSGILSMSQANSIIENIYAMTKVNTKRAICGDNAMGVEVAYAYYDDQLSSNHGCQDKKIENSKTIAYQDGRAMVSGEPLVSQLTKMTSACTDKLKTCRSGATTCLEKNRECRPWDDNKISLNLENLLGDTYQKLQVPWNNTTISWAEEEAIEKLNETL